MFKILKNKKERTLEQVYKLLKKARQETDQTKHQEMQAQARKALANAGIPAVEYRQFEEERSKAGGRRWFWPSWMKQK